MDKYEALSVYFGYSDFRSGQEEIIDAITSGRDVLGIMPTGAGKSICFQIPALMAEGTAIVISPLISLMKDQVNSLCQNGISAAYINGSLSEKQISVAISRLSLGMYKLVYVAPERLSMPSFISAIGKIKISMICVDEAHCVSQWGQDFRPSYLLINDFISGFEKRPVVCAMTATATERVKNDIVKLIGLKMPKITILSFDRKNLYFGCYKPKSKPKELRRLLDSYSGKSGIVYCSSRKRTDALCEQLSSEGYSVTKYHAGLSAQERKHNQELFINDEKDIIIATNAFGMGIDKSNVSFVIHYNMPGDIESYYQEAGRAGRDGNAADCIMLFNGSDISTQRYFIDNPEDNGSISLQEKQQLRKTRIKKLNAMIDYTKGELCLRKYILAYFGEEAPDNCSNCSVCLKSKSQNQTGKDITIESQKILSCIARVGQKEGKSVVADILLGRQSEYIEKSGYEKLSTFSIMSEYPSEKVFLYIDFLAKTGYIKEEQGKLTLTEKSREILFGKKQLTYYKQPKKKKNEKISLESESDIQLFEKLRVLRKRIADEKQIPAFVVFSDATLVQMAIHKPCNEKEFLDISGVGLNKLHNYGAVFIKEICSHVNGFFED